jgi:hypothetical protein
MRGAAAFVGCVLGALGGAGCLRSVDDLPERPEGAIVSGQVVTRSGASGDWAAAPGVAVSIAGLGVSATTNADGFFSLTRLPVNRLLAVRLTGPRGPGEAARSRVLDPVRPLLDGQTIDLGVVRLGPGGALAGRALLQDGLEAAPRGAGGTLVVLAQTTFKAVTDEAGLYQLPDLPEGTFELVAFQPGYLPARVDGVEVLAGATVTPRDLVLLEGEAAAVTVSGFARVLGAASPDAGHEGITVRFEAEGGGAVAMDATTGPDGAYSLSLPAGVYRVTAQRTGLASVVLQGVAVLPEGVLGLVEIYLAAPGAADFDGDGVPDSEDDDDDNDGCRDAVDAFPQSPAFCFDNDGDGVADEIDLDDDDDGLADAEEVTPGADGWITNPLAKDTDGDGVEDLPDVCPTVDDDQQDSDGDGRGDACDADDPINTLPPPVITGFSPAEAGAGTLLEIFGRNFDSEVYPVRVQFGLPSEDGRLIEPSEVNPSFIRVEVPASAETGQLRVFGRGRAATSTGTFTFRPGPRVVDLSPRAGRRGSRVVVIGEAFDLEDLAAFVNGAQATLLPFASGALVETRLVGGVAFDALQLQVPDTTTGRIEVRNRFGASQSPNNFEVTDAGVVIDLVTPNPTPAAAQVALIGHGFSTDDLVDPPVPEVIFNYGGAEVRLPLNPGWTDSQATVQVPPTATTGQVALVHPAADRPVVYREVVQVDPLLPYITAVTPTVMAVGDALTIFGGNLTGATRVEFTGGVAVTGAGLTASPGTIQLTVPPGALEGPVTVTTPRGMGTSPFRLARLVVSPPTTLPLTPFARPGFGVNGDEFFALLSTGDQVLVATSTAPGLAPRISRTVSVRPLLGAPLESFSAMSIAPSGQVAVLQTNQQVVTGGRLMTVGLPAFNLIGVCARGRAGIIGEPSVVFDGNTTAAYARQPTNTTDNTREGVLRIDLSDGSCEELFVGPLMGGGVTAHLPQGRSLLMTHGNRGWAVMDVDPSSPLYGTLTTPWTGPGIGALRLFPGPGSALFYEASSGGIGSFDPSTGTPPALLPEASVGSGAVADGARRYLMIGLGQNARLVDMSLQVPRVVRVGLDAYNPLGAGKPGTHAFITVAANPSRLVRMDIRP